MIRGRDQLGLYRATRGGWRSRVAGEVPIDQPLGITSAEAIRFADDQDASDFGVERGRVFVDGEPATVRGRRLVVIPDDWRDADAAIYNGFDPLNPWPAPIPPPLDVTLPIPTADTPSDEPTALTTCILIASKDGQATIGRTIEHCTGQADVYVVSDGSTDGTVGEAERHGATVMDLAENVGKPNALRAAYFGLQLGERYDAILVLDDDTRLAPDFVDEAMELMKPGVAVVCGETRSDWIHDLRWNGLVGSRALAYWRYGLFLKQGQHVINAINVIPGSNSIFRTDVMTTLLQRDVRYIVDDTQWLLDIQTEKMGRVVYTRQAKAYVQDPTTLGAWYNQTLRWLHGTMQGIRGHRIGRRLSWFSATYSALIVDWFLYVVVWPFLLAFVLWRAWLANRLGLVVSIYVGGYVAWAAVGAIAVRNWRLPILFPTLMFMDWVQRTAFVHAFFRTWRVPTSDCKWVSPARHDTRKELST